QRSPSTIFVETPGAPARKPPVTEDVEDETTEPVGGPVSMPTLAPPTLKDSTEISPAKTRPSLYGATLPSARGVDATRPADTVPAQDATRAIEEPVGPPPTRVDGTPWAERKE